MGASAGPSLQGIGRGGDSNLVLEMDAHDAKSYPGEPTTNLIPYYSSRNPALVASVFSTEALWTSRADSTDVIAPDGSSTTTKAVTGTTGNSYLYTYMDAVLGVTMASSTTYTLSVWAKTTNMGSTTVSLAFQDRGNGAYDLSSKTITTEWQRFSLTITTGSGATSNTLIGWNGPTNSRTFYFWGWQVEQKGYATPYVVSQLLDPSAQGPSARPASVNLMIHGNVGTGTSFYDSSPSKHTITSPGGAGNAPTHTSVKSKFSGGSFHFDASDHLIITDNSEFDFGTGDFTVDFWTNVDSGSVQDDTFFSNLPSGGSPPGFNLSLRETEPFSLGCYSSSGYIGGGGVGGSNYTNRVIYKEIWYHIAVVRVAGVFYTYVNGALVGTDARYTSLNLDSPHDFYLGRFYTNVSAYYLNAYVDEFRVTKGTALWTNAFTPPTRRNLSAPVVDRSGSNNGGNFATKSMTDVSTYRVGEVIRPIDSAVWDFDGTDDHIGINGCDLGTGGATLSCWFKTSTQQTNKYLMAQGLNLTGANGFDLNFQGTKVASYPAIVGGLYSYVDYTVNYHDGKWHMLVVTYNGTKCQLYYDGGLVDIGASAVGGLNIESTNRLTIGSWVNTPATNFITGQMAIARAYKVGLTAQQIVENFNQQRSRFGV